MTDIFLKLVNMSITASWLVLVLVLARPLLIKAPRWVNCLLWAAVVLRLTVPFSFESIFSAVPSAQTIQTTELVGRPFEVQLGVPMIDHSVNSYLGSHYYEGVTVKTNTFETVLTALMWLWLIGVAAMLIYSAVSYIRLRKTVAVSLHEADRVYVCDAIDSPFLLGILFPRIYLPSDLPEQHKAFVLAHEQAHIRRRDHWWKPLGFFLLSVYWFNPLLWVAYCLFCRDVEAACDEKVIAAMDAHEKQQYSQALVACSVHRRKIMACPVAFGEVGVKSRIRSILHYKKPTVWLLAISVLVCAVFAGCMLTDPPAEEQENPTASIGELSIDDAVSYYRENVLTKDELWYGGRQGIGVDICCPASERLMEILCFEQWQETDAEREDYLEQCVFSQSLGRKGDYSLKLTVGTQYGGIEWYREVTDEIYEDGAVLSREEMQGVRYFALPQESEGGMVKALADLSRCYEISKNPSVYLQNGDLQTVEKTAFYHVVKTVADGRYLCLLDGGKTVLGFYENEITVRQSGDYVCISADGEEWYEPTSGWYWNAARDIAVPIDRILDRRGDCVVYQSGWSVHVHHTAAHTGLADIWLEWDYYVLYDTFENSKKDPLDFVEKARFTADTAVELTYYGGYAAEKRVFTFEVADLSKTDPHIDPPKTALHMPESVFLEDAAWTDETLLIEQEGDHSLHVVSSRNGEATVTLSESEICRLNRLYESITDFSRDQEKSVLDAVEVTVRHDGETARFPCYYAAQPQLNYYIDQLIFVSGKDLF